MTLASNNDRISQSTSMAVEASGPLTALWVTVLALSVLYIAVLLAIAYFNAHPEAIHAMRQLQLRMRRHGSAGRPGEGHAPERRGGAADASVDGLEDGTPASSGGGPRKLRQGAPEHAVDDGDASAADECSAEAAAAAAPLHAQAVALEWRSLSLSVAGGGGRRQILQVRCTHSRVV
jgi:hypothetical protein